MSNLTLELLSYSEKQELSLALEEEKRRQARKSLLDFVRYTKLDYIVKDFNRNLCEQLDRFQRGEIKKLIVTMPPQHGKSEITTRRFPAYLLGKTPTLRVAICSYSATIAESFNRNIQNIIDTEAYQNLFPETCLNDANVVANAKGSYLRNSEIFEIVKYRGFLKSTGVCGPLTSTTVDVGIIDDPIKDRQEAKSVTYRQRVWEWYTDVFKTRLHNDSQQLIIMTRWDQDDLVGRILLEEHDWEVVKYEAIKRGPKTYYDQRNPGEALFPEKHSLERLLQVEKNNELTFNSLYQQDPKPSREALVFPDWEEIDSMPVDFNSVYGLDFGFSNDPTAIVQVCKHNLRIYAHEVVYKTHLSNNKIKMELLSAGVSPMDRIYADSAEAKSIEELKKPSLYEVTPELEKAYPKMDRYIISTGMGRAYNLPAMNVIGATKGPGSIHAGITMLKEHQVYLTRRSLHLWHEQKNYEWVMQDGKPTNDPIEFFNHGMDAIRYAIFSQKPKRELHIG